MGLVQRADELNILAKHPSKWFTSREIFKLSKYNCEISSLISRLKRLRKGKMVYYKYGLDVNSGFSIYYYKHREDF